MIGYLDMPSGISGDMLLGCLVDAGWPIEDLRATIASLNLPADSWRVQAESVMRGPLRATFVDVRVQEPDKHHRRLNDIRQIITDADLPAAVKDGAIAVFVRLAEAEAKVHGSSVEDVHFHEVGALDAIVDIVGNAAGLHALGVEKLYASPLPLGGGWVNTAHGDLPLPAPATLEILAAAGAPSRPAPAPAPGSVEFVTPTGAALIAQFATFTQPQMNIQRIAVGCGRKEFDWPNVARLWLGEPIADGPIIQLDTNIDDMNPQFYADVCEHLFDGGALDVWLTPVQMKKNRPAVVLSVLAPQASETELAGIILRETTTLGLRVHPVHRHEAAREMVTVNTAYGPVKAKLKRVEGAIIGCRPEYEDCRRIAAEKGVPVQEVYEAVLASGRNLS